MNIKRVELRFSKRIYGNYVFPRLNIFTFITRANFDFLMSS